jgi:hypothetical protein
MTSKKTKLAYFLFFSCFTLWLALILSVCLPSGSWTAPIRFPNFLMLTLFVGSAIPSSITAMVIGLDFLGINSKIHRLKQNSGYVVPPIRTRAHEPTLESRSKDFTNKSGVQKTQNFVGDEEENARAFKSIGKNLSVTEQNAITYDASVKTKDRQKSLKRATSRKKQKSKNSEP